MKFPVTCATCGQRFFVKKSKKNAMFCSLKCRWKGRSKVVTCEFCGKEFSKPASMLSPHNFCSRQCTSKWKGGKTEVGCDHCGKLFLKKNSEVRATNFCSIPHRREWLKTAANNPNWKDGASFEPYPPGFNNGLKDQILKRDNHECQVCGAKQSSFSHRLPIHHINYIKTDLRPFNLIATCPACNGRCNQNRARWQARLEAYQRARGL